MMHVLGDLLERERPQMVPNGDSLSKLAQIVLVQPFSKLGLAHEHNLQKLPGVGFKIREQPDLFKQCRTEILRLVNNENRIAPQLQFMQEKLVDCRDSLQAVQ